MEETGGCFFVSLGLAAIIAVCYFGCSKMTSSSNSSRTVEERAAERVNSGNFSYRVHSKQETFEGKNHKRTLTTNTVVIE